VRHLPGDELGKARDQTVYKPVAATASACRWIAIGGYLMKVEGQQVELGDEGAQNASWDRRDEAQAESRRSRGPFAQRAAGAQVGGTGSPPATDANRLDGREAMWSSRAESRYRQRLAGGAGALADPIEGNARLRRSASR